MLRAGGSRRGNAYITGGTIQVDNGAVSTPSYSFASVTNTGFWYNTNLGITVSVGGSGRFGIGSAGVYLAAAGKIHWDPNNLVSPSADTDISRQAAGRVAIMGATATPAGGSTALALVFGSTSGFGIYIGSGVPTVSAAQGSLYLRSDGSSTSTRAYINSSAGSGTTWTAITTAA
jgi:hypothetical protein